MKNLPQLLVFLFLMSCSSSSDYSVATHLTPQQQDQVMDKLIRYLAKAPEGLLFEERFYAAYKPYYDEQKSKHKIDAYFIDRDQNHFFLISRQAPSLVEKRVATGGKVKFDENYKIEEYEETFRTWKMTPDTLKKRSTLLFDKMVKGESLEPYLTKNSKGVEYIEFPDDRTTFNKKTRQWETISN